MRGLPLRALERRGSFLLGGHMAAGDIEQALAGGHGPLQPTPRSVLVPETVFHAHGGRAMRELGAAGNRSRRVLEMAQLADMHGFDFVFAPAEEPRPGRIDGQEITL